MTQDPITYMFPRHCEQKTMVNLGKRCGWRYTIGKAY